MKSLENKPMKTLILTMLEFTREMVRRSVDECIALEDDKSFEKNYEVTAIGAIDEMSKELKRIVRWARKGQREKEAINLIPWLRKNNITQVLVDVSHFSNWESNERTIPKKGTAEIVLCFEDLDQDLEMVRGYHQIQGAMPPACCITKFWINAECIVKFLHKNGRWLDVPKTRAEA